MIDRRLPVAGQQKNRLHGRADDVHVKSRMSWAKTVALLRPCATSAGFLATPEKPRSVDMARLKSALVADGYKVVVDARIILIVRKGIESSIYDNGKVLIKTTEKTAAEKAYADLEPHLQANFARISGAT